MAIEEAAREECKNGIKTHYTKREQTGGNEND
jgi:hypothetical protein